MSDFGLAKVVETVQTMTGRASRKGSSAGAGTAGYKAPETYGNTKRRARVYPASDVFSFSMVVYQTISRQVPFHGMSADEITRMVSDRFDSTAKKIVKKLSMGKTLAELEEEWLEGNELEDRRPEVDDIEESCPKGLSRLMQQCWADSPEDRPGSTHIVLKLKLVLKKLRRSSANAQAQQVAKRASLLAYGTAVDMVCADSVFADFERDLLEQKRIELGITEEEHHSEFAHRLDSLPAVDAQSQQLSVSDVLFRQSLSLFSIFIVHQDIMLNRMIIDCWLLLSDRIGGTGQNRQIDGPDAGGKNENSRDQGCYVCHPRRPEGYFEKSQRLSGNTCNK